MKTCYIIIISAFVMLSAMSVKATSNYQVCPDGQHSDQGTTPTISPPPNRQWGFEYDPSRERYTTWWAPESTLPDGTVHICGGEANFIGAEADNIIGCYTSQTVGVCNKVPIYRFYKNTDEEAIYEVEKGSGVYRCRVTYTKEFRGEGCP